MCHPVHHNTARLWRQASTRSTLFKFPLTEFCSSVSIASVSLDRGRVQAAGSRIHCRPDLFIVSPAGITALCLCRTASSQFTTDLTRFEVEQLVTSYRLRQFSLQPSLSEICAALRRLSARLHPEQQRCRSLLYESALN